jgi:ABC-type sugar transport system permease subunit
MPVSVTMPQLGESVTEGTVTRWLKHEGDRVEVDEPLLEVSTDKVDTEIPSPAAGVLSTVVSTALELILGIALAYLLAAPIRLRWLFRAVVILPWALPTIVNGAMWRWILNAQYGAANAVLTQLHLQEQYRSWLGTDPFLALNMVVVADVWKNTSLVAFFLLAGLQTIPNELYEAARVDGAGPVRSFFRITLPLLTPTIAIVLVLRTIEAFKVFDIIYVMTGGGPASGTQTITFLTYLQAFSAQRFSVGAALAYLTVLAILVLAMVYLRLLRQSELRAIT